MNVEHLSRLYVQSAFSVREDKARFSGVRFVREPAAFVEYVSPLLFSFGHTVAGHDCNVRNVGVYASWVAQRYLEKAARGVPQFAISACLSDPDESHYWRCIAISCAMEQGA
jgi:hypothetical protein